MNVKIVTKSGRSFGGAAEYLLHDEGRRSSHRVLWTDTQGLGTKDPEAAWRVMAATAMDAERLKRQAGVPATGRKKEGGPVLHLVLSWAEGEIDNLSAQEMRRAAREAVSKLGKDTTSSKKVKNGYRFYGDECQMLLVAHSDKKHPHVHVLLNRVHPTHGRLLPDGNDHLKLSKWAQKYQERCGNEHLTPKRALNNAARERGEYVKGDRPTPRPQHEGMQAVSDEQAARKAKLRVEQTRRAAAIAKAQRDLKATQRKAFEALQIDVKKRLLAIDIEHNRQALAIVAEQKRSTGLAIKGVRDAYRPQWETLYHELQARLGSFRQNEEKLVGRVTNALRAIDLGALVGRGADDGRAATFREAFGVLASRGAREAALKREHEKRELRLRREQKQREAEARGRAKVLAETAQKQRAECERRERAEARREFVKDREGLTTRQAQERGALQERWRNHDRQSRAEWKTLALLYPKVEGPTMAGPKKGGPEAVAPTRPRDLVGTGDLERGAKLIDSERERRAALKAQIDAQLGRDDEDTTGRGERGGRGTIDR
jgi:hypothetical protein